METVLLAGGAGYIGSHAAKRLREQGYLPVVYDNLSRGHAEAVKWGPLERGSLGDRDRLREAFRRHRPRAVMHFAAYAYVGESMADPGRYYANNVSETLALLDVMVEFGVRSLVFSSTCATYGVPDTVPIAEDQPQAPVNPYGRSKLMVEQILGDYERAHGLRSVCLRYFNAAGADPEGETGEDHDPETHLIPLLLDAALGKRESVQVFGHDYPTPDGTCVRDYIHVCDLAEAHVLALRYLETGGSLRINLGNGKGFSVLEVVETVRRVTGRPVRVEMGPRRPGDPPELVGDASQAKRILGWNPRLGSLDDIVSTAWNWHRRIAAGKTAA